MDVVARHALWELVHLHIGGHPLGLVERLVAICAGPVDTVRHCGGDISIRFAVTGEKLRTRKERADLDAVIGAFVRET